ncbi:MAG: PAS domain-containing sensor histidine kinase, partial [Candidatus Thorarchaeota archaeon]
FRTDLQSGLIIGCNLMGAQLFGYDRTEELEGKLTVSDMYMNRSDRRAFIKELEDKGSVKDYLLHLKKREFSEIWAEISSIPYPKEGYLESVVIDVTDRRRTEQSLAASESRYRELIENLPAGLGITDLNEILTLVNPAFCNILGYNEDELVGINVLDTILPRDRIKVQPETELRKSGVTSSYEIQVVRKDGSSRDVSLSAVPHRNDQGDIIGTIGVLIDISEAKHAEVAIRASEKRLRSLIEQLPLGVAIADLDECVELVNQALAEMLWQERNKLVGQNLTEYLTPEYASMVQEQTETRKMGVKSTYEVEMVRTDGIRIDIRVFAAPNYSSTGEVRGSVGVFQDITDEKQNEAILMQQEQEINLYGSLLRHDLRNDLGLILSYIETVQMLLKTPDEEIQSFLISAMATIERMADLLKYFGRPQDVREVDIVEFITSIALETQEAEKGLKISVSYDSNTPPQRITAGTLLALVFMNLFRNSAQHAGEEPIIEVNISESGQNSIIRVSDNGPGISPEFQERLFARGISSKGESGGLGLYLCRQIMERTGGSIELLKTDKGAAFELVLPLRRKV